MGAAAGLLLLGSLSGFLSELSGERLRVGGLGLSLIFEALGVVLLVLSQGRRSSTAGVTLAALGTIPLVFFTFFDVQNESTLVGGDDVALTSTVALLVAAALWFAGHLFGPSRSHVLFLGAALVAVWMAITIQVVDDQAQPRFDQFGRPAVALEVVPVQGDAGPADRFEQFEDDFGPGFEDDFQFEDDFGPGFEDDFQFEEDYYGDDPFDAVTYGSPWDGATNRFGWSTLLFGLVYLGAGRLFDRAGDTRRGTAFFAVATPLAYYGASFVDIDRVWMRGVVFLLIGAAAVWAGARRDRRFTAWSGTLIATAGLVAVVVDIVGEDSSGTTFGITFLIVGLALAAAAHFLDGGPGTLAAGAPEPGGPAEPPEPGGPGGPAGPPLVPPPPSHHQPSPTSQSPPAAPAPPPDDAWAPRPAPGAGATPPPFDPRPPGSNDPLPTDPGGASGP